MLTETHTAAPEDAFLVPRVRERPMGAEEVTDPYRRGMLLTARATGRAERGRLREVLGEQPPASS